MSGYAPQAQYHTENAMAILGSHVQMSSSDEDKANILTMSMTMHYVHGMALANLKKYPYINPTHIGNGMFCAN